MNTKAKLQTLSMKTWEWNWFTWWKVTYLKPQYLQFLIYDQIFGETIYYKNIWCIIINCELQVNILQFCAMFNVMECIAEFLMGYNNYAISFQHLN